MKSEAQAICFSGTAQHGHMMNIGYELYCKFVADAVKALQGEIVNDDKEETLVEIPVGAYIPDRYIEDETLKLHMYKKIAEVETEENEEDVSRRNWHEIASEMFRSRL